MYCSFWMFMFWIYDNVMSVLKPFERVKDFGALVHRSAEYCDFANSICFFSYVDCFCFF
jgi:hypothetical protein